MLREQAIDDDALNEALKKYATSTSLSVYYNEDTVHAIYQMEPPPGDLSVSNEIGLSRWWRKVGRKKKKVVPNLYLVVLW